MKGHKTILQTCLSYPLKKYWCTLKNIKKNIWMPQRIKWIPRKINECQNEVNFYQKETYAKNVFQIEWMHN